MQIERKNPAACQRSSAAPPEFAAGELVPDAIVAQWLGACGQGTRIFRGCRLVGAERIEIGRCSQIDEGVWIFAGEKVTIGDHVHMTFGSSISGGGRCVIHAFVGIGAGVRLITGTDLTDGEGLTNPTIPDSYRRVHRGAIEIGAHAVVFTNAVIFPDVTIGEGVVVAAGSLVHRDLPAWGIFAGNPLVQIGVRPKETVLRLAEELRAGEKQKAESRKQKLGAAKTP
jgi:acetyltransferase-like isoleucine patch superfamily enzyme